MSLNTYFAKTYYINLDRRPDLRTYAEQVHAHHGITAERIAGFDMLPMEGDFSPYLRSKGHLGCTFAHMAAVNLAKYQNLPNVLILEDDCTFVPDLHERWAVIERNLPDDWELLYLGAMTDMVPGQTFIEPFKGELHRMSFGYCTHAYAVKASAYDRILIGAVDMRMAWDQVLARLMGELTTYVVKPALAFQTPHWSETDYKQQTFMSQ